jgi:hypothetical protein
MMAPHAAGFKAMGYVLSAIGYWLLTPTLPDNWLAISTQG